MTSEWRHPSTMPAGVWVRVKPTREFRALHGISASFVEAAIAAERMPSFRVRPEQGAMPREAIVGWMPIPTRTVTEVKRQAMQQQNDSLTAVLDRIQHHMSNQGEQQ